MAEIIATATILDRIVEKKLELLKKRKARGSAPPEAAARSSDPGGDFMSALSDRDRPGRAIIAEIKRASPSAGVLREDFRPEAIARAYEQNGARCISVITEQDFFQGSLEVLARVRDITGLPLLCKDFIIDPVQIEDAARAGANAALLISRILDDELMRDLYQCARDHQLAALIEVHDEKDLERVKRLDPPPALIGVNNRDLADFSLSIERTLSLIPLMPEGAMVVSESGLNDPATLERLRAAGVSAFLIGTALMKADDEGAELYRLVHG